MVHCTVDGDINLGTCTPVDAQLGSPWAHSCYATITSTLLNPVKLKLSSKQQLPTPTCLPLDPDSHRL